MSDLTVVGIADMKIIRNDGTLITYALGSCVGVCIYDPVIKLASMIHVMLPYAPPAKDNLFKYADTGIPETIRKMEVFGALRSRMTAKIVGGAKMFNIVGDSDFGNVGTRNVKAVRDILRNERILLKAQEVEGTVARTLLFNVSHGEVTIKTFGLPEKVL